MGNNLIRFYNCVLSEYFPAFQINRSVMSAKLKLEDDFLFCSRRPKRRKQSQKDRMCLHVGTSCEHSSKQCQKDGMCLHVGTSCDVGIQDLPYEILVQIFSYLGTGTLLQCVAKVCRQWNMTRKDPSLYRALTFRPSNAWSNKSGSNIDDVIDLVQMARWLKKLELVGRTDTNEILRHVRYCSPLLETLKLINCRGTNIADNVSAKCLVSVFDKCNSIRHLKLKGSTYEDSPVLYNSIGRSLTELRSLSLEAAKSLGSAALLNLGRCRHLSELRVFGKFDDMDNGLTSDRDMATLCKSLCGTLTVLKVNGWNWTNVAVKCLARCSKLKKLHINDMEKVTDEGIVHIAQLIKLEKLSLVMCNNISARAWAALMAAPTMSSLRVLRLAMCSTVTDDVARAIAGNCTAITKLMLTGNDGISDVGLLALISGCHKITHLDIHLMEPVVFNVLPSIPEHVPHLTTLVYDYEWKTEFMEKSLGFQDKMPGLQCSAGSRRWDMYYNFVDSDD